MTNVLLVVLGGLFGWLLGKIGERDERIVYIIAAAALIVGILVFQGVV